jgi:hypothetical protein
MTSLEEEYRLEYEAERKREGRAIARFLARHGEVHFRIPARGLKNHYLIVHRNVGRGPWRITQFWHDEPTGHENYKSYREILLKLLWGGYDLQDARFD